MDEESKETVFNDEKKRKRLLLIVACIVILGGPLSVLVIKHKKAQPVADSAVTTAANNIAALEALVKNKPTYDNLVNLSVAYVNNNAPGRAIPYLKAAIKIDPAKALAYNNLGVANIMLKNYQQGIEACAQALSIDNTFQLAKNNLKWGVDEKNKALALIEKLKAASNDKNTTDYYIQLGLNYLYVGDYDNSITTWQQGLAKDAGSIVLINDIGTAKVMKKDYDGAITEFNKVLAKDPNNQLAKNNIAWATSEKTAN